MPEENGDKSGDKPLNSVERKMLKDLVNGDFEMLEAELAQYAEGLKRNRIAEINEQFAGRQELVDACEAEYRAKRVEIEEWITEFRNRWREQGVTIRANSSARYAETLIAFTPPIVGIADKEQALNQVENDVRYQLNAARTALTRQKSSIQRQILLTGLSSNAAQGILGQMPNPQSLLEQALATRPQAIGR